MSNIKSESIVYSFLLIVTAIMLSGCTSYATPGGPADMSLFSTDKFTTIPQGDFTPPPQGGNKYHTAGNEDIGITRRRPTAKFPVNMVTVRVQEPGYESATNKGYGLGNYSVVTVRDVEKDEDFDRMGKLHGIAQVSPLSRLLLPSYLRSDKELRKAAARLQADMILIYTLDTNFYDRDKSTPLSIITLGLGPTIDVRVISSVSVLVMDTRTGYIYGLVDEAADKQQTAAVLTKQNAFDQLRQKTERKAFEMFLDEFEVLWRNIVRQYRK